MSLLFKKIITSLVLTSFLVLVFFGIFSMIHDSNEQMQGDCPLSTFGTSLCVQDTIPAIFHHISAYQSFFNVPINFGIMVLIISLLLYAFILFISLSLFEPPSFIGIFYDFSLDIFYKRKIAHWLSLLENSPSFS